jgi:BolA protein
MTATRIALIEARLREALAPTFLEVRDDSHLHKGHAGARDGRGHFHITIAAPALEGVNTLAAHRMIYAALGDLMQTDIHAVGISVVP